MTPSTAQTDAASVAMSAECRLAQRPEYRGVHDDCRQTKDIPLPHSGGRILLARRCGCSCHRYNGAKS